MSRHESHTATVAGDSLMEPPRRSMAAMQRIFGAVFLLLMAALLALVAWWTYAGAVRDGVTNAASLARLAANQTARMVESADLLLVDLQRIGRVADWTSPAVAGMAGDELEYLAAALPHVQRLTVFGPDGRVRASSDPAREPARAVTEDAFFRFHAEGGEGLYVSPLLRGRGDVMELVISRPVAGPRGAFDGIVTVALDPAGFATFYRSLKIRPSTVFLMVHDDMSVIIREPAGEGTAHGQGVAESVDPILRRFLSLRMAELNFDYADAEDRAWVATAQRVERYPLHVMIGVRRRSLTQRWIAETLPYLSFGGLALIALGFLVSLTVRQAHREDLFRTALMRSHETLEHRVAERTTSLAEALEQKDVLFRELNHRVKNNLQIVASLLRLQAGRFQDPTVADGFKSCLGRIQSMSAVHEMLYRKDDVAHVDFRDYLTGLARRLGESYGAAERITVTVDADPDLLVVGTAVPLALFVNEVVSNSFKHAFPEGRRGRIDIAYRVDGDTRRLAVRDDGVGVGPEGAQRPGSLGMQLARALASQLGGSFVQEPGEPGSLTTVEFSLAGVREE